MLHKKIKNNISEPQMSGGILVMQEKVFCSSLWVFGVWKQEMGEDVRPRRRGGKGLGGDEVWLRCAGADYWTRAARMAGSKMRSFFQEMLAGSFSPPSATVSLSPPNWSHLIKLPIDSVSSSNGVNSRLHIRSVCVRAAVGCFGLTCGVRDGMGQCYSTSLHPLEAINRA